MKNKKLSLSAVFFLLIGTGAATAQDYNGLIKDYFNSQKSSEFSNKELMNFAVSTVDHSQSLKGDVIHLEQAVNGVTVYGTAASLFIKNDEVRYSTDNFVKSAAGIASKHAAKTASDVYQNVLDKLSLSALSGYSILNWGTPDNDNIYVVKQRNVYFKNNTGLVYAYEFSFPDKNSSNYWDIVADANTGEILSKYNLTVSEHLDGSAFAYQKPIISVENQPTVNNSNLLFTLNNASYNVFPFPIEAPTFGSRSVVSNPWNVSASPQGWHSNGTTNYTNTRGNNVYAYDDRAGTNAAGSSPSSSTLTFNYAYDGTLSPINNLNAAITNLFYTNNMIHDISYKFGFTPSARNFQSNNFGNGGVGNDYVLAEAQDGGGYNNANFASPSDGSSGRMQMYLWDGSSRILWYNAPSDAVSRTPSAVQSSSFGKALNDVGVTANVKAASTLDACTALPAGSLTGYIGLAQRGTCNFTVKAKNLQNAGAVAALIYDNASGNLINMSGTDATITIPAVFIQQTEGDYIKSKLDAGTTVNITLRRDLRYDGSFDNGIMSHEYTHGISNRLTGTGYNCLSTSNDVEQMGEGWSDFMALMTTNQPGATAAVARGIGTYAIGQATTGAGIRPAPYSPDFSVNDYTYADTTSMQYDDGTGVMVPDVHSIGFVWASILWDLHWKYADKYGYASDVTANANSGSARVLQLVMDAMKLQPCNPDFVTGRDALLAADLNTTGGTDYCMIYNAFAKRGVGVNASPGSATDVTDQVEDFTVPPQCNLGTSEVNSEGNHIQIYPNPAKNEFFISASRSLGKSKVEIYDASGKLVKSYDKVDLSTKPQFQTEGLQNGVYIVKVSGISGETSQKLIIKN